MCKAPMQEGGARMEQYNDETNKLDETHANSHEICTRFVRMSWNLVYSNQVIHGKVVRISYHVRTNFT